MENNNSEVRNINFKRKRLTLGRRYFETPKPELIGLPKKMTFFPTLSPVL